MGSRCTTSRAFLLAEPLAICKLAARNASSKFPTPGNRSCGGHLCEQFLIGAIRTFHQLQHPLFRIDPSGQEQLQRPAARHPPEGLIALTAKRDAQCIREPLPALIGICGRVRQHPWRSKMNQA